ncbi:MAG: hypothetical protein ISS48_04440 [Candidatus Aenigmarchaeota archaeon]|nr:hypothetical protein [Candidatus Aenigmarchaeota archaeon]
MKAQAEVTEIFSILGIIVVLIALIPVIIPTIQEAIRQYTLDSPDVVSKDLAALISISAAAPRDITIKYDINSENDYEIDINNRLVIVSRERLDETQESSNPILVDVRESFLGPRHFTIEKKVEDGITKYQVDGE